MYYGKIIDNKVTIIKYEFLDGVATEIEVPDDMAIILSVFDKAIENNDRKESRRHVSLQKVDEYGIFISCNELEPKQQYLKKEKIKILYKAISKLYKSQQKLIIKYYFYNKTMAEIADDTPRMVKQAQLRHAAETRRCSFGRYTKMDGA